MTKSRNSWDFRSKARTCQRRPLSISANGDDLPLGAAAGDGVVLDAERTPQMDRTGHARQHIQIRVRKSRDGLSLATHALSRIGSPSPKPRVSHDSTRPGKVEDGAEVRSPGRGLAFGGRSRCCLETTLVERQIPGCRCGLDAKPRNQVLPTISPRSAHVKLNEREPVALRLGQFCKLVFGHS